MSRLSSERFVDIFLVDAHALRYNGRMGMKPLGKVKIAWSPNFAYAIGLIATDGCLYRDGRHINLTTKDLEQAENFLYCLNLSNKIGRKARGNSTDKKYYVIQFGDVIFYNFLLSIGITPAKSHTIGKIKVPDKYFFDFLRGHFDGDGSFYSYFDPRWRSSFMFYTEFLSASLDHITWLRGKLKRLANVSGHVTGNGKFGTAYQLKYAKAESLQLLPKMYYDEQVVCLSRKREKIDKAIKDNLTHYADVL